MYPIDIAVFAVLVLAWVMLALGKTRTAIFASLAGMAMAFAAIASWHWQALPALLVAVLAAIAAGVDRRRSSPPGRGQRFAGLLALAAAGAAALLPYHFFPLFTLPSPDGRHAVGTMRIELVDRSRLGVLEDAALEPRRVMVQLWYPADRTDRSPFATYLRREAVRTEAVSLARNMGLRPFQLLHLASVGTHSRQDARAEKGERFPLLVFNHGYMMYPGQNLPLFEKLASHGYVVASVGHVYDSTASVFRDGSSKPTTKFDVSPAFAKALASLVETPTADHWDAAMPDYTRALAGDRLSRSASAWLEDTRFVLMMLERGKLAAPARQVVKTVDFSRVAFAGMSFGGGVAAKACEEEARCAGVVSLDGVTYDPALFDRDLHAPLMAFYSDWMDYPLFVGQLRNEAIHPMDFAFRRWTRESRADDLRLRVRHSGHMTFTDMLPMLRRPKPSPYDGTIAPAEMDAILGDFTLGFLDHFVRGRSNGFPGKQFSLHPLVVRHDPALASRQRTSATPDAPSATVGAGS